MNSDSRRVGPLRCLLTAKPRIDREPLTFFRCPQCGSEYESWISSGQKGLSCCNVPAIKTSPLPVDELPEELSLWYDIVGGLNENCVRVYWRGKAPDWLYLETFTGGQHMILGGKRRPPAVFALAGDDAYAYCDKNPCEMCSFRCKNGFVIYAKYAEHGLFVLPVNRIAATSGSPESRTKTR